MKLTILFLFFMVLLSGLSSFSEAQQVYTVRVEKMPLTRPDVGYGFRFYSTYKDPQGVPQQNELGAPGHVYTSDEIDQALTPTLSANLVLARA